MATRPSPTRADSAAALLTLSAGAVPSPQNTRAEEGGLAAHPGALGAHAHVHPAQHAPPTTRTDVTQRSAPTQREHNDTTTGAAQIRNGTPSAHAARRMSNMALIGTSHGQAGRPGTVRVHATVRGDGAGGLLAPRPLPFESTVPVPLAHGAYARALENGTGHRVHMTTAAAAQHHRIPAQPLVGGTVVPTDVLEAGPVPEPQAQGILNTAAIGTANGRIERARTLRLTAAVGMGCTAMTTCILAYRSNVRHHVSRKVPRYLRTAIMRPQLGLASTPWKWMLLYGTDADFIVSINVTRRLLLSTLLPHYEQMRHNVNWGSPYRRSADRRGRPAQLRPIDALGLALWFLKSRCPAYKLCPIFGIVPSSLYVWLDYALEVLFRVLNSPNNLQYEIRWPIEEEMRSSASLLERNREHGHLLQGVFGMLDGGRMPCASYVDADMQNAFWEGFTQGVEVTNLLVWNFHGEIIFAAINFPGSWHDSKVANVSGLYDPRLRRDTKSGYALLGDSAFPRVSSVLQSKIIRSRKVNEHTSNDVPVSAYMTAVDLLVEKAMPSERQSAEWGVRALKGPFKRLTVPLSPDVYARKRIISCCAHLYNFRVRYIGLNQIRTVYSGNASGSQPWLMAD